MICPICGTFNDDNIQTCGNCGNNIAIHSQEHFGYQQSQQPQQFQQPQHFQQPQQPEQYLQQNYQQPPAKNDPGKILGIVGFILSMASLVSTEGIVLAIVGLILSAVAKKQSAQAGFENGFAKAGIITGSIITALSVLVIICFILLYSLYFVLALTQ